MDTAPVPTALMPVPLVPPAPAAAPAAAPPSSPAAGRDEPAISIPANQPPALYIGDLSKDVTEVELTNIFKAFGTVTFVKIPRDVTTRASLGYAYVDFADVHQAAAAMQALTYTAIRGRPCRIMWSQRDPQMRRSGAANLFVRNLPEGLSARDLWDAFRRFGNVLSVKLPTVERKVPGGGTTTAGLGFGYVQFDTDEAARAAVEELNATDFGGKALVIEVYVRRTDRQRGKEWTNVFVRNLPRNVDEVGLRELFTQYGDINSVAVGRNEESGKSLGFGFVDFATQAQADAAIAALNGIEVPDTAEPDEEEEKREAEKRKGKGGKGGADKAGADKVGAKVEGGAAGGGDAPPASTTAAAGDAPVAATEGAAAVAVAPSSKTDEDAAAAPAAVAPAASVAAEGAAVAAPEAAAPAVVPADVSVATPVATDSGVAKAADAPAAAEAAAAPAAAEEKKAEESDSATAAAVTAVVPAAAATTPEGVASAPRVRKLEVMRHLNKADRLRAKAAELKAFRGDAARTTANLYVKNLPLEDDFTEDSLRDLFKPHGTVTSVVLVHDNETKLTRGFGYVNFAAREEAERALRELNGKLVDGKRPLYVSWHETKVQRVARLAHDKERAAAAARDAPGYGAGRGYAPMGGAGGMGGFPFGMGGSNGPLGFGGAMGGYGGLQGFGGPAVAAAAAQQQQAQQQNMMAQMMMGNPAMQAQLSALLMQQMYGNLGGQGGQGQVGPRGAAPFAGGPTVTRNNMGGQGMGPQQSQRMGMQQGMGGQQGQGQQGGGMGMQQGMQGQQQRQPGQQPPQVIQQGAMQQQQGAMPGGSFGAQQQRGPGVGGALVPQPGRMAGGPPGVNVSLPGQQQQQQQGGRPAGPPMPGSQQQAGAFAPYNMGAGGPQQQQQAAAAAAMRAGMGLGPPSDPYSQQMGAMQAMAAQQQHMYAQQQVQAVQAQQAQMQQQAQAQQAQAQQAAQAAATGARAGGPSTTAAAGGAAPSVARVVQALTNAPDRATQRNILGEHLYPLVHTTQPQLAGKITGMLLEMDAQEIILLLEDSAALNAKIAEAVAVLRAAKFPARA